MHADESGIRGILAATPADDAAAQALSLRTGWPVLDRGEDGGGIVLAVCDGGLEARDRDAMPSIAARVDFLSERMAYRRGAGRLAGELIGRAVGSKEPLWIVDATAGFGRDAFLLAALGHRVTAVERVRATAELLADGLARARADAETADIANRIAVVWADAREWLLSLPATERPDVVYCDPIFPDKGKSAAVKKEMRLMRLLAGPDADAQALHAAARETARRRVIVKRWQNAAPLSPGVSHAIPGKMVRFDVYCTPPAART